LSTVRLVFAAFAIALATASPGYAITFPGELYCAPVPAIEVLSAGVSVDQNSSFGGFNVEATVVPPLPNKRPTYAELKLASIAGDTIIFDVELCDQFNPYREWGPQSGLATTRSNFSWLPRPHRIVVRAAANSITIELPPQRSIKEELDCARGVCLRQTYSLGRCIGNTISLLDVDDAARSLGRVALRWDSAVSGYWDFVGPMLLELGGQLGEMEFPAGHTVGEANRADVAVNCIFQLHREDLE
jgi:hypothetical protein